LRKMRLDRLLAEVPHDEDDEYEATSMRALTLQAEQC